MKFLLFSAFALLVLGAGKKKGKSAQQGSSSTSNPSDNFDWDSLENTLDPIKETYSSDIFTNEAEYFDTINKAYRYVSAVYYGNELFHQHFLQNEDVFFETFQISNFVSTTRVEAEKNLRKLWSVAESFLINDLGYHYFWKFFYNNIKALAEHNTPSFVIYDVVTELSRLIESVKSVLKAEISVSSHYVSEHIDNKNNKLKIMQAKEKLAKFKKLVRAGVDVNEDVKREAAALEEDILRNEKSLESLRKDITFMTDIAKVFMDVNLQNPQTIDARVNEATRNLRSLLHSSSSSVIIMYKYLDHVIIMLRLYNILFPIVAGNRKFLDELRRTIYHNSVQSALVSKKKKKGKNEIDEEEQFKGLIISSAKIWPAFNTESTRYRVDEITRTYVSQLDSSINLHKSIYSLENGNIGYFNKYFVIAIKENAALMIPLLEPFKIEDNIVIPSTNSASLPSGSDHKTMGSDDFPPLADHLDFHAIEEDMPSDNVKTEFVEEERINNELKSRRDKPVRRKGVKLYNWYKNSLCDEIDSLKRNYPAGYLSYTSPSFLFEKDGDGNWKPRTSFDLDYKNFDIICKITRYNSFNIEWSVIENFLKNQLKAQIEPLGGSKDNIYIPTKWSTPVQFHIPHSSKTGRPVAKALFVLFRKIGIFIGKFRLVTDGN